MRQSPIFVAALLSLTALASPAFAFDIDSSASPNPDGTARYADPDDKPIGAALGAVTAAPRSGFTGGVTTSTSPSSIPQSWQELDWANPMPPRAGSLR
jgi:hypothetical protein